jgi:hypothetical protein
MVAGVDFFLLRFELSVFLFERGYRGQLDFETLLVEILFRRPVEDDVSGVAIVEVPVPFRRFVPFVGVAGLAVGADLLLQLRYLFLPGPNLLQSVQQVEVVVLRGGGFFTQFLVGSDIIVLQKQQRFGRFLQVEYRSPLAVAAVCPRSFSPGCR